METNIKTAISKIIDIQRGTVNKLKFNENAILSISSQINSLNITETDPIYAAQSGQFALKTELFSGSYIDLSNKPDIPTKVSDLTNDLGFITSYVESDPIYAAQSSQFQLKSEAFDGNYNSLSNKPTIPTKLSDLTNDLESITEESDPIYAAQSGQFQLKSDAFSGSYNDLTNKPNIPTKVSELNNDLNFISGYTETDPIYAAQSGQFQLKSDAFSGNYNDLTNKPDIPTKLSDLTNDLGNITEESDPIFKAVSGQFVTKDEINEFVNNDSVVLNLILDDINGEENELLSSMNNILNEIIN